MLKTFFIIASVFMVAACSSDGDKRDAKYLDADYLTQLELPPDLISADGSGDLSNTQLRLPKPSAKAIQKYKEGLAQGKLGTAKKSVKTDRATQLLPQFDGLRLRSDNGLYYLEVDQSKEEIWTILSAFWQHEGVTLNRVEPTLGLIETKWVSKYRISEDEGFFSRMFAKVDRDNSDRFRMRLAEGNKPPQTKVFVAHSGLERVVEEDDSYFAARPSDRELEVEVLSRLLVFMGLTQKNASDLLVEYKPLIKRSLLSETEKSTIIMSGSLDFVWLHTLHAIDRLGLAVSDKNLTSREIKLIIQRLAKDKIGGDEDEVAESSYIMQWLRGDGKNAALDSNKQFILKLRPRSSTVAIEIQNLKKEPADSVLAEQLAKGLLIELQ